MFSDEYIPGITVKSSWKSSKKLRENGSQTSEILTYEVDNQTAPAVDSGCQTVPPVELLQNSNSSQTQNVDTSSLIRFLSLVEPAITKQLRKNSAYNVFKDSLWGEDDSSSDTSISCEYCLIEKSVKTETQKDKTPLEVTCISWNSSGGSIVVGYGSMKHMAWGQASSYLCVWNLNRPKVNLNKCDQKLEVESSIQMVAFHPSNPALLAAGLFSGVVLLWELSHDDVAMYSSESHEDPVTSTCWLEPHSQKYLNLMSASTDGKLIIWKQKIGRNKQPLEMVKKFQIKVGSVRSNSAAKGSGSVGVTCCAITVHVEAGIEMFAGDERTMIAGCENGAIIKCSINEDSLDDDPVVFSYKAHTGPVYSIEWSPFHRHVFLTCSTDQRCRFYHSLHASPLREVTPYSGTDQYLFACRWSPARALTLFSGGGSGVLAVYDANCLAVINSVESESENGKRSRVNCIETNKKRLQYVATGNAAGIVHIWQLGSRFTTSDPEAKEALNGLAEQAMTED